MRPSSLEIQPLVDHGEEENPAMLLLKELESIAGKVDRLTVYNGTGGLMNDIVRLRDA